MAGVINKPGALNLSGNINKFVLSSSALVSFVLKKGSDILLQQSYEPGPDGLVTIDVKDVVESQLNYTLDVAQSAYIQTGLVADFTATIDNVDYPFRVIRSGVANLADTAANWLKLHFLTWQPRVKSVTYYSPEWLTYYAVDSCTIKLKATYPDKTTRVITLYSCPAGSAVTLNLQYSVVAGKLGNTYPSYYEVWTESGGTKLSESQLYTFSDVLSEDEQWYLFENSLGGLDTFRASGTNNLNAEHEYNIVEFSGVKEEYQVDTERKYTKNTGYLDEYSRRWLLDFFPSRAKYVYESTAIRKIVVTESNVTYISNDLPSSYTFSWQLSEVSPFLNLIKNESDIPDNLVAPDLSSPDFIIPPRLAEYPRVELTEGVLIPAFDPFNPKPGVTSFGAIHNTIKNSVVKELEEMLPGPGGGGGTDIEIIESNDLTPETDQNVYSAARAKLEDEKRLRKDVPDLAREHITFAKGLTVTGGATVDSLKVTGLAEAKTLNVTETATTMDLIVKNLAETYDLNVSHVATLFRTIIKDYISSELFIPGFTGSGTKLYQALNGDWNLELDNLTVRKVMNVFELIINKIRSVNGAMVISQSNGKVESVTNLGEFHQLGINEEYPTFQPGDLVRCQRFTGRGIKYYWVTVSRLEGSDIVVAKSEFDSLPEIGDELVQMGNVSNPNRQSLIYLSAAEDGRPVIDILNGVNSKSFAGKLMSRFGCLDNITDTDFPSDYQPSGYGLYSVNCFLKGIFVLRNGKTVEGALTELGSMYSSLQTELSAVPGQITLAVREGVENVQIGGVNMFDDSATERHNVGERCEYYELTNATTIFDKHGIGKYTISFDCKADKAGLLELYCCPGVISDFKYMWQEVTFQFNATTIYQRFSFTFTVYLNNHESSWSPISLYGVYGSGVAPWIKNIKLEQGTKATTWSPSPHDTSIDAQEKAEKAQIAAQDYAETQVYLAKIEANAYADGVVDEEEARAIAEARAKLEEAKNHANEAARAAQDAAAIDASNKDQIVKSELNSSIEVLRGRIELKVDQADFNNLGERLSSAESKIILNADSISQTVTKTEFNSLELGGRNLCIGGTGIFYADRFFNLPTRNILSPYITADGAGREIVVSFDIKVSISRLIHVYPYQSSGISIANSFDITPPAGEWKRYNFKTKIYKYADIPGYTDGSIGIYDYAGPQNFQIRFFKIELGNKATDWSPAPEDLENDAQTKADAAQQAAIADALAKYPTKTTFETSIQQLSNSISFKASQTSVNGIESRLSAAEIKIEPTQINFTVKQQVDTAKDAAIADTTGKINNIQVGGVNLLENTEKERNIGLEYAGIDITSVAKANLGKYLSCSVEVYIPTGGTVSLNNSCLISLLLYFANYQQIVASLFLIKHYILNI